MYTKCVQVFYINIQLHCNYSVKTYITNIPKLVTIGNDDVYNYKNIITECGKHAVSKQLAHRLCRHT